MPAAPGPSDMLVDGQPSSLPGNASTKALSRGPGPSRSKAQPELSRSEESMFSSWLSSKREESVHPSRAAKERPLPLLSLGVVDLFRRCNPAFQGLHSVPRRTLTQPSDPVFNGGLDNADHNLICRVHDTLTPESKADGGGGESQYVILDNLGQGTFGQVFRCQEVETGRIVAVKIIRNKPAYLSQAWIEVKIAKLLNDRFDPNDENNILRLLSFFMYRNHLCLVFELLSINVYELLKQNQFRGLPLATIRPFAQQVLQALKVLQDARIIHCDLKPENILLRLEPPAAGGSEAGNGRKSPGDPSSSGAVVPATPPASMPSTAPPQDSSSSSGGGGSGSSVLRSRRQPPWGRLKHVQGGQGVRPAGMLLGVHVGADKPLRPVGSPLLRQEHALKVVVAVLRAVPTLSSRILLCRVQVAAALLILRIRVVLLLVVLLFSVLHVDLLLKIRGVP
mmetsp:Transcript_23007/g.66928  ORF Transcript_23007/g.66928 Transcript_23007/m.66928 type:complete len:451 (-) Transcript_23007:537-1889(-)